MSKSLYVLSAALVRMNPDGTVADQNPFVTDIKAAFVDPQDARDAAARIGNDELEWSEHDAHGLSWTAKAMRGSCALWFSVVEVQLHDPHSRVAFSHVLGTTKR